MSLKRAILAALLTLMTFPGPGVPGRNTVHTAPLRCFFTEAADLPDLPITQLST